MPLGLLGCYVLDLSTGLTPATGKVAEYLGPTYSLAQLQAMDLWGRMDSKIAAHGGAAAISAAVTAAEQARKV